MSQQYDVCFLIN